MFVRAEILEVIIFLICMWKTKNRMERNNWGKWSMLAIAAEVGNQRMGHHHLMFAKRERKKYRRESLAVSWYRNKREVGIKMTTKKKTSCANRQPVVALRKEEKERRFGLRIFCWDSMESIKRSWEEVSQHFCNWWSLPSIG